MSCLLNHLIEMDDPEGREESDQEEGRAQCNTSASTRNTDEVIKLADTTFPTLAFSAPDGCLSMSRLVGSDVIISLEKSPWERTWTTLIYRVTTPPLVTFLVMNFGRSLSILVISLDAEDDPPHNACGDPRTKENDNDPLQALLASDTSLLNFLRSHGSVMIDLHRNVFIKKRSVIDAPKYFQSSSQDRHTCSN